MNDMNIYCYDALIIGFGKGGKTLAQQLAHQGKKAAFYQKSTISRTPIPQ